MSLHRILRLAPALAALAFVGCGADPSGSGSGSGAAGGPSGVLLISVDSLRADHLSCYGYESPLRPEIATSPNLDARIAAEGTLFERVVATTSWTVPAHMAMLSGQPDEIHGVKGTASRLPKARPLLAQRFEQAGWRTGGFFSGPNLHPYFGFGRGFEVYEDCTTMGVDASRFAPKNDAERKELRAMEEAAHRGHTGPEVVRRFGAWLDGVGADERFFAFVHFWDVHYDYEPPAEFDLFDPDYEGEATGTDIPDLFEKQLPGGARDTQHIVALYDGEILFTDDSVGKLLDALEGAGRLDDTLVVFTADHGEEFAEHGRFGHNKTLYEEVVRVPLVLRLPDVVPAGQRIDELVSLVDIAPTIVELAGLPVDRTHWGRSLAPALNGEAMEPRPAPLSLQFGRPEPGRKRMPMEGSHAGTHKVVRNWPGEPPILFDLEADPDERKPADATQKDPRIRAAKRLWRELQEEGARLPSEEGELPAELEAELRAVGYLGGEE